MLSVNLSKRYIPEKYAIIVLGAVHALIDACCAVVVFSMVHVFRLDNILSVKAFVLYNVLAFGLQPLCGIAVDSFLKPKLGVMTGIVVTFISLVLLFHNPWVSAVLAGLGNAFFHVSGGVVALKVKEGYAASSGYFVAPGAIGLAVGTLLGDGRLLMMWTFLLLFAVALITVCFLRLPSKMNANRTTTDGIVGSKYVVIGLLLISVALRSLLGFEAGGPWKGDRFMLFVIAVSAALGKASGGVIADRFGWQRTGASALLFSSMFFIAWPAQAWGIVCGTIFLQMTMPITLAALYRGIPGKSGLAFGLASLALIVGALPVLVPCDIINVNKMAVVYGMPVSAVCFYIALFLLTKKSIKRVFPR